MGVKEIALLEIRKHLLLKTETNVSRQNWEWTKKEKETIKQKMKQWVTLSDGIASQTSLHL